MKNSRIALAFGALFSLIMAVTYQIEYLIYIINVGEGSTKESSLSFTLMIIMFVLTTITAVFDLLSFSTWNLSKEKYDEKKWENYVAFGLTLIFSIYIISMYIIGAYEVKMFGLAGVLIISASLFLFVIGMTIKIRKNKDEDDYEKRLQK